MKRTRDEAYDKLYSLAVRILARMNACSTCPISKGCVGGKERHYTKLWCCEGCPHAGPTGCTVEALACRLWLCDSEVHKQLTTHAVLHSRMARLVEIAKSYNLYIARADKQETLEHGLRDFWWLYNHSHRTGYPI